VLYVVAALVAVVALAAAAGGGGLIWANQTQRDAHGFFTSSSHAYATNTYALTNEGVHIGSLPDWLKNKATIRVQASGDKPLFVGIGREDAVARYLAGVAHDRVNDFDSGRGDVEYTSVRGVAPIAPPAAEHVWTASATGMRSVALTWPVQSGRWSAVVMNADGSRDVATTLRVGARVPALRWVAIGFLAGGGLLLVLGGVLIYLGVVTRGRPASSSQ
jgi:hypothetical protein